MGFQYIKVWRLTHLGKLKSCLALFFSFIGECEGTSVSLSKAGRDSGNVKVGVRGVNSLVIIQ